VLLARLSDIPSESGITEAAPVEGHDALKRGGDVSPAPTAAATAGREREEAMQEAMEEEEEVEEDGLLGLWVGEDSISYQAGSLLATFGSGRGSGLGSGPEDNQSFPHFQVDEE
jgi:hypothetical protein